ncbi:MAG: hypothetical protein P4L33_00745 [Capsulimonadaceae bacterium]|nr:hypothetical protein [Capsulimonadaceae bacterium]
MKTIFRTLVLGLAAFALAAPQRALALEWGVCGHPFTQAGYTQISLKTQFSLMKELGATWYRDEWDESSYANDPKRYVELVEQARHSGIQVLPILRPKRLGVDTDPQVVYSRAYAYGYSVAQATVGLARDYEIENELDGWSLNKGIKGNNGLKQSDYDSVRLSYSAAELRGLRDGVKAADPAAKTMIDFGWLHFGYVDAMVAQGVSFDILAWHYYAGDWFDNDCTRIPGFGDAWSKLRSYGRPIWVTECNHLNSSDDDPREGAELANLARQFQRLPNCEVAFVYELLDEPWVAKWAGQQEAWYGLVHTAVDASGTVRMGDKKPAYDALKRAIAKVR